jgi:hypothetical protein
VVRELLAQQGNFAHLGSTGRDTKTCYKQGGLRKRLTPERFLASTTIQRVIMHDD